MAAAAQFPLDPATNVEHTASPDCSRPQLCSVEASVRTYLVVLCLFLCVTFAASQQFGPPANYRVGPDGCLPWALVAGDFNNDGKPDLAVLNYYYQRVVILQNQGDGSFATASTMTVVNSPVSLAAGDFDGDGNLDLVVGEDHVNFNGTMQVFLGNGDGHFTAQAPNFVGNYPTSVAVADFNHDGKADILVGNYLSSNLGLLIFIGNGDGSFQPPAMYRVPGIFVATTADLNGDGWPDVVLGTNTFGVAVLLNSGDGTLAAPVDYHVGAVGSLQIGDLNEDGKPDVLATGNDGLMVFLGNGDGTLGTPVLYRGNLAKIAVGDFNVDGKQDVAVTTPTGGSKLVLYYGNGDGTLQPRVSGHFDLGAYDLTSADFDGNGSPDLAAAISIPHAVVSVLLNVQSSH